MYHGHIMLADGFSVLLRLSNGLQWYDHAYIYWDNICSHISCLKNKQYFLCSSIKNNYWEGSDFAGLEVNLKVNYIQAFSFCNGLILMFIFLVQILVLHLMRSSSLFCYTTWGITSSVLSPHSQLYFITLCAIYILFPSFVRDPTRQWESKPDSILPIIKPLITSSLCTIRLHQCNQRQNSYL